MSQLIAVIGANYGDEGKGYMTDYFCAREIAQNHSVINVLSNGGGQRGHTVETIDGGRFVFHHMGAGTMAGADSYFSVDYIVNPMILLRDYQEYEELSIKHPCVYSNRFELFLAPECRFSTPYDMMANQIFENARGKNRHGSVGVGIWETVRRYEKGFGLTVLEFMNLKRTEQIHFLEYVKKYFEDRIFHKIHLHVKELSQWNNTWNHPNLIPHFLEYFQKMCALAPMVSMKALKSYDIIVVENAQGVLLSQHRYDGNNHTTPSDTGAKEIQNLLEKGLKECIDPDSEIELCYVSRSYLTKHGAGELKGECNSDAIAPGIVDLTNQPNPFQGTLRYAMLEEKELIKQILEDEKDLGNYPHKVMLSITHLNEWKPDLKAFSRHFRNLYLSDGKYREACYNKRYEF